jgi:SIR2-like domain
MVIHRQTASTEGGGKVNGDNRIDTVIVLGAGASAADGAPIQSRLFREYFENRDSFVEDHGAAHKWDRELSTFFHQFFGIDVDDGNLDKIEFPTFEEILGLLEIADSQGECFRDLVGPHLIREGGSQLQHIHGVLVFSIAEILHHKLRYGRSVHDKMVKSLKEKRLLRKSAFISFNYDILIDNALLHSLGRDGTDYGVEFVNQKRPRSNGSVRLFKLHGSLNWLFCPACRDLKITPGEKSVMQIKWEPNETVCEQCQTPRSPIVIPPTFFKVLSNLHLRTIWDAAEWACRGAKRTIFCGYSLPDADIHVRYLAKRVERSRGEMPEMFIVNHHDGKGAATANSEMARYRRFFVNKQAVHYTDVSFQEFAEDPNVIEEPSRWQL